MNTTMTNKRQAHQSRELETIKQAVAHAHEIYPSKLYGKGRRHEMVVPRQIAMYLCREIAKATLQDIAKAFNKKHHCTIIHACKTISNRMAQEPILADRVATIRAKLEAYFKSDDWKKQAIAL